MAAIIITKWPPALWVKYTSYPIFTINWHILKSKESIYIVLKMTFFMKKKFYLLKKKAMKTYNM